MPGWRKEEGDDRALQVNVWCKMHENQADFWVREECTAAYSWVPSTHFSCAFYIQHAGDSNATIQTVVTSDAFTKGMKMETGDENASVRYVPMLQTWTGDCCLHLLYAQLSQLSLFLLIIWSLLGEPHSAAWLKTTFWPLPFPCFPSVLQYCLAPGL